MQRIGGLQTQHAPSGYIGLWSRLAGLRRDDYTAALNERRLIQGWLMRVTIHTVAAHDYWPMALAVRDARRTWWLRTWGRGLTDDQMRAVAADIEGLLRDGPMRLRELHARMAERGHPRELANAGALWVDLVRVPPQGTWEKPRADNYGLAAQWLPAPTISVAAAQDRLLRSYLAGFGPAALADISGWTGLAVRELRAVVDRAQLVRFSDQAGRELLDLPNAPLPDAATPAPVRFIGSFDPILLVQARRAEILPEEFRPIIFNQRMPRSWHTFLIDGRVAGTWSYHGATVDLQPLRPLTALERPAVDDEAYRLEAFLAG